MGNNNSKTVVWDMWKTCFGDPDNYMELYFKDKYRPQNTLIYHEGEKAVASLQMLPYSFTFHGIEIPSLYLSGVCTLPEYRKRGYTRALLIEGFNVARERGVPLMFLVPQEQWLMNLYAKYGFAQTFDPGEKELPSLKKIVEDHPDDIEGAYRAFDGLYRRQDMTVQKSLEDFKSIVNEGAMFNFPPKKKLIGMARAIDAERLLTLFATRNRDASFCISVTDELMEQNNESFDVEGGKVARLQGAADQNKPSLTADIGELAQWLLGYHTAEKGEPISSIFMEKSPQMHFMLE